MKKYFKVGFGWTIGCVLGQVALMLIAEKGMKWAAKNKAFMEYERDHNPENYEKLKKYQPETKEGS